jgi:hypothetical protein
MAYLIKNIINLQLRIKFMKTWQRIIVSIGIFIALTIAIYYVMVILRPVFGIYECPPCGEDTTGGMVVCEACMIDQTSLFYNKAMLFVPPIISLIVSFVTYRTLGKNNSA